MACLILSDLFADLCILLSGCGYYEKAVALFQAELEFSLFRPAVLGSATPHKDAVDFLSVYWDSNAPKFGEDASRGWAAWVESGGQQTSGQFWYSKGMYHCTYLLIFCTFSCLFFCLCCSCSLILFDLDDAR